MILCFSKVFTQRKAPVRTLNEFLLMTAYMAIPLVLVVLQPDFGTAMVYLAVFAVMIFLSGTNTKLLLGLLACLVRGGGAHLVCHDEHVGGGQPSA